MNELLGLAAFSFVSAVTPGPNNVILWASGSAFGFRRTVPHVLGTAIGLGLLALVVAGGLGALITGVPQIAFAMKVAGSLYLLWLAYRMAHVGALHRGDARRPFGLLHAAAFQALNPKAWIFALGAITTFRPPDIPVALGSVLVAVTMMVIIVPCAALWAVAGDALGRLLADARARRAVSLVLAVSVAATVVLVWT
jgi:threonine/homoserine/homoserine lactone efflux protein